MGKRILLVDDDDAFRKSVKDILEIEDYEVLDVDDGIHALDMMKHESVDLVLSDILMPEMEGNALAAKLKSLCPGLPIVGMTGGGRTGDPEKVKSFCLPKTFCVILSKPFLEDDLYSAINTYLKDE